MATDLTYKKTLRYLIISIITCIIFINLWIILIPDDHDKHSFGIVILNITAAIATVLGIVAVVRNGISRNHGRSYLFLTIGIALWFAADLGILYSYFFLNVDEFKRITLLDVLWLSGYLFLAFHLVSIIRTIKIRNTSITLTIISIIVIGIIIINVINLPIAESIINSKEDESIEREYELQDLIVTILYPILDLSLIIPSITILLNVYKEYQHSVPWILASLSLLINALADIGYTNDFIKGLPTALPWDLFYIADFIIMSGALFWYNKFHITEHISKNKKNSTIN